MQMYIFYLLCVRMLYAFSVSTDKHFMLLLCPSIKKVLLSLLLLLLNSSLLLCVCQSISSFSFAGKSADVDLVPIYKGRAREIKLSLNGLCSTIGKVLSRIVHDQILLCVDATCPLNKSRHGFSNKRSTLTNTTI